MRLLPVGSIFGAIPLAGCSLAPDHVRAALPVRADWVPADRTTAAAVRPTEWRQFFAAPALDALITTAQANSRDLRIAISRVEVARGEYRVQRAEGLPQISGNADAFRFQVPKTLSPTRRARLSSEVNLFAALGSGDDVDRGGTWRKGQQ